jgi:cell division protein FtsI/penicillin-binding protein 2
LLSILRERIPGTPLRIAVAVASVVAGGVLATATLPQADHLQDRASSHMGFDER